MFPSLSFLLNNPVEPKKPPSVFLRLPEEVQNKIKSYLNPVVTRTFHDHLSSLRSQPAKDEQTHEDVLIFSEKNNTTQKNLYFKYLETHDALATAQIICDDIKKKSKIDISLS